MTRPVLEGDHRTALRVLAFAVACKRRTFFLSFPDDDDDDDEPDPTAKATAKLPVIPRRRGAQEAQAQADE
jgi:hypothetical protein